MSYGLKLGCGGPIGRCIGGVGGTLNLKEYAIALVQGYRFSAGLRSCSAQSDFFSARS